MIKLKNKITTILILNCLLSFSQVVTEFAIVDSYVHIANSGESFSSETSLKLKHSVSGNNDRYIFIQFSKPTILYEQVLLKLVQTNGNKGNVSLVGTDTEFDNSITLNSSPSEVFTFNYGGVKKENVYYIDVTEYLLNKVDANSATVAFKLFTNSIINTPIEFSSNEDSNINNKPQLLFYTEKEYDIPLFDMHDTVTIDMASKGEITGDILKAHNQIDVVNNYGGWSNGKFEATGFFRTEQDCNDTWHIIDPLGNIFYSAGLNTLDIGGGLSQPNEIKNLGLNTMGSWSNEAIKNIAYTPRFNVLSNFKNTTDKIKEIYKLDILPVFEPGFKNFCIQLAEEELQPYINDPWVLGYFLDNELLFHKNQLSLSLTLETTNAQYQEANNWMITKYGASYSTADITEDDQLDYQGYVGETYFKTVSEAFKAVDPNHMLLGTRFHSSVKYSPLMFEAAGKYVDIVSVNYYGSEEPEEETMEMWLEESNKPFMITEFYVKGLDTPLENEDGAGWDVDTQTDRANWFENWMLKLLRNKGSVGFHWFRYLDKPTDGSNKGLYDKDYKLYQELGASVSKVSKSIYTLRSQILYGNYNYNDCDENISILSSETTNISDVFQVYPNPVLSGQTIHVNSNSINQEDIFTIKVLNLSGKLVKETVVKNQENNIAIETKGLISGVYFIQISSSKKTLPAQKIMIK